MLTDAKLKSQVDALWDKLWTGGLSNPLDAIEQLSYLLFLKRLDDAENQRQRQAQRRGQPYTPQLPDELRWSIWTQKKAADALTHLKQVVFPQLRNFGPEGSSFRRYMANAECKINRPNLLIEACKLIDQMQIAGQQQDVQGDMYEYLLGHLSTAGRNGQFRTPRHIIRMMVQMLDPKPGDRVGDLAAGTCGFLVNAYQYMLEQHTSTEILTYDAVGWPHNLVGDLLTPAQREFLQSKEAFRGYDNDSGMTMLRIGSMNLMLHGLENPQYFYMDTLSDAYEEQATYDVILMNPPFKGKVDKSGVHETLPSNTTKSELLFLHLILRALDMGGRAAVIVPDGVLFGSSRAHQEIRQKLVAEHGLMGVVSMPSGVFKPYAGVSTAILFFAKGGSTERIWFYDMAHDGFSLDDKRQPVAENDIPDILACWQNRHDAEFAAARQAKLAELKAPLEPLQQEQLQLEGEANRLTFEQVIEINGEDKAAQALAAVKAAQEQLQEQMAPLQAQIDQLGRQFWVTKKQVKVNKYDLSASRYREIESEPTYYEQPQVTMERLITLERVMADEVAELQDLVNYDEVENCQVR
ncbi:MAG: N-6 DNA methylase [Anaerolineae bacterium]|nr:N-6 DNA methylase [Anaerolineae bacterium]